MNDFSKHKAGFVNIIGNPNVGKSTLLNAFLGEKLSAVTQKAQTTRHRILGIINEPDFQIVFSDTPGILSPKYKLHDTMMKSVGSALVDADILLYMIDPDDKNPIEPNVLGRLQKSEVPVFLLINKCDTLTQDKLLTLIALWKEKLPGAEIISLSALKNINVDLVFKRIVESLPLSPPYYDKEDFTDRPERFFVSEIIREKILLNYRDEVPYSVEVVIESFKDEEKIVKISSTIYVARDSQKGIIIGNKGAALKKVGIQARKDIETFLGKQVFLEMHVKVAKDWRDDEKKLKNFGYWQ